MTLQWLCVLAALGSCQAARILGIFPSPSISHQQPYQAVMKALAERGHQVTVISTDPQKLPRANYTDIDLSFSYKFWAPTVKEVQQESVNLTPYEAFRLFATKFPNLYDAQLSSDVMQNFIKSKQQFDLVFIESMIFPCMLGLVSLVGSPPVIGILSIGGMSHTFETMGSPFNPGLHPDIWWPHDDQMTFWERTDHFVFWVWSKFYANYVIASEMEKVSRRHFGNDIPSIWEMEKNYSLMMLNNHWTMSYPMPTVPGIIELGSLHLQTENKPLPKDIKEFLDGASEGFVYFSLGSNVKSDQMPEQKRNEFLAAFAELPQRVLWKWESNTLPGQPKNVMLGKWLPQQDILAHPNIKVFITQGGLQSLNEATHNAVPLVVIPFYGDQHYNMRKVVNAGAGLKLDFETATKATILKTLQTVITDTSYSENMKKLSTINKDQPETPIQRAVWWTEYVLRHNGARHLRSAALDLNWIQYLLLDVIAFLVTISIGAISVILFVCKIAYRCIAHSGTKSIKSKND